MFGIGTAWLLIFVSSIGGIDCSVYSMSVTVGDTLTLPCILPPKLSENRTVIWSGDSGVISEGVNITTVDEHDRKRFTLYRPYKSDWFLKISPTTVADEGIFRCNVDNKTIATVTVNVEYKPSILGYDGARDVYLQVCQTTRVELWCNMTGKPPPSIRWFYQKHKIASQTYVGLSNAMIFIPNVESTNAGLYSCQVTNKHGSATMIFHISVIDQITRLNQEGSTKQQHNLNVEKPTTSSAAGSYALCKYVIIMCILLIKYST